MQAQAAGGGEGAQGLLQNPKVQIGVIAGGALALIVVIFLLFFNNGAAPAPDPGAGAAPGGPMAGVGPGGTPPLPGSGAGAPVAPGGPGALGAGLAPAAAPMAAAAAPGAAPGAPTEPTAAPSGPGVPVRKNPFVQNKELVEVLKSIPPDPTEPLVTAQAHSIYVDELYKPKPQVDVSDQDEDPGPPIPTMRVAGVVYGRQVSATLQIGSQYMQVTPGQMIPASNPVYRVDSIEQDTVHLSRRWEIGSRKGVQRIEVGLAARAATQGGAGMGGGMPGGYPGAGGYPGSTPTF